MIWKTTAEDTPVDVDVLGNDTDPTVRATVPASVNVTSGPAHGGVGHPATGVVTYTPRPTTTVTMRSPTRFARLDRRVRHGGGRPDRHTGSRPARGQR